MTLKKFKNTYSKKLYSDYEKIFVMPGEEFVNEETPKMMSLKANGYVTELGLSEELPKPMTRVVMEEKPVIEEQNNDELKESFETKIEVKPVKKGRRSKKSKRESKFKKKYEDVI